MERAGKVLSVPQGWGTCGNAPFRLALSGLNCLHMAVLLALVCTLMKRYGVKPFCFMAGKQTGPVMGR